MSGRTSVIQHQANQPIVIIHRDFMRICDGDEAAAIILSILEYWTNVKLDTAKQGKIENENRKLAGMDPVDVEPWIYKSGEAFIEDSLGLLKEHDVSRGLKLLLNKGFISRRHNPKFKWDRTWQYILNIENVNSALCIPHPCGMESEQVSNQLSAGAEAIPEITTEVLPETSSSTPPTEKQTEYQAFLYSFTQTYPVLAFTNFSQAEELAEAFDRYGGKRLIDIAAWMAASSNGLTSTPQFLRMVARKAATWNDEPPAPVPTNGKRQAAAVHHFAESW